MENNEKRPKRPRISESRVTLDPQDSTRPMVENAQAEDNEQRPYRPYNRPQQGGYNRQYNNGYNRPYNNMPTWHVDNYWTKDNTNAYLPRYAGYNSSLKSTPQTRYLQNVAYLRLKSLQIGYNLPKSFISKINMQKFLLQKKVKFR